MTRLSVFIHSMVLAIALPWSASGTPAGEEGSTAAEPAEPAVVFGQEEIPEYLVVSSFFQRAASMLQQSSQLYGHFIENLGLEPGSPEADFFAEKVLEAENTLRKSTVDTSLTGAAFMDFQYEALREKARVLATIYQELLEGLDSFPSKDAAASPSSVVHQYCQGQVRPSLTVTSSELDNRDFLDAIAEFDRRLDSLKN